MRRPEVLKYLFDISEACRLLRLFTVGKTFQDYESDPMLRSAVERQFEIIGEALRLTLKEEPELRDRIRSATRILAFRNRLVHGYATVSDAVVWGVLEGHLGDLEEDVASLLAT